MIQPMERKIEIARVQIGLSCAKKYKAVSTMP